MEHDNGSVVKHLQSLKNQIIDYESTLKNLKNKQFFEYLLSK